MRHPRSTTPLSLLSLGPMRWVAVGAVSTLGLMALPGCSSDDDESEGTLRVTIYGEPYIEQGIPAVEFVDGWAVTFSSFEIAVTDVRADGTDVEGGAQWQLAMDTEGEGQLYGETTMPAGTVAHLDYRITAVHAVGEATRGGDTFAFDWSFDTDTTYVDCETEQSLADGGSATSQMTIHADHLFYDDLVSDEPNVAFDLIATADGDGDGSITRAELAAVDITAEDRYQVGDAGITDLDAFVEAQTRTLGHIDGEGHCDTQ